MQSLRSAISSNDLETIKTFTEESDINALYRGETALIFAISQHKFGIIKLLIARGADPNVPNSEGITPLITCIINNELHYAKFLIEKGANTCNPDKNGYTPLAWAVHMENSDMIELLLANYAHFTLHSGLMEALENGNINLIKFIIEKGADVNLCDETGNNPLMHAINKRNLQIVNLLIENGAAVNYNDCGGCTPLMTAVKQQNFSIVKNLVERGADVNKSDFSGQKALDFALKNNDFRTIELLLNYGALIETSIDLIKEVSRKYPDFGKYLATRRTRIIKRELHY